MPKCVARGTTLGACSVCQYSQNSSREMSGWRLTYVIIWTAGASGLHDANAVPARAVAVAMIDVRRTMV